MYYYFKGKVTLILKNSIVLETNSIGREFLVSNPNEFNLNEEITLYSTYIIRDNERTLIGFRSYDAKMLFSKLIQVNEVGPKTALLILKYGTPSQIVEAINTSDMSFFTRMVGVNKKISSKIMVELNNKVSLSELQTTKPSLTAQVFDVLKQLGFDRNEIDKAISKVPNKDLPLEIFVQQALKNINSL